MNTRRITIGRIVFAMAAIAMLMGFVSQPAGAENISMNQFATNVYHMCTDLGGTPWTSNDGMRVGCDYGDGHGFGCNIVTKKCWSWLTASGGIVNTAATLSAIEHDRLVQSSTTTVKSGMNQSTTGDTIAVQVQVSNPTLQPTVTQTPEPYSTAVVTDVSASAASIASTATPEPTDAAVMSGGVTSVQIVDPTAGSTPEAAPAVQNANVSIGNLAIT